MGALRDKSWGMLTENKHHEIAKAYKAGRLLRVLTETGGPLERVCCKDMAVLCISNALRGGAIGVALARLSLVQGSMWAHIHGGSDGAVGHGRSGRRRGHGCSRVLAVATTSWLPAASGGRLAAS
jgi:hypothetical protein